jgi:hypothetical protein
MKTKDQTKPLTFHSLQIIGAIEGAFDNIAVDGHEIEKGAVRLTVGPLYSATVAASYAANFRLHEIRQLLEEMGWSLAPAETFGQLVVLFPGYCVQKIMQDLVTLRACVSYYDRHMAKNAGYEWYQEKQQWRREFPLASVTGHCASVPFKTEIVGTCQTMKYVIVPEEEYSPESVGRRGGRLLAAQRKSFGGPAKVFRNCPHCGEQFSGREMRRHAPHCTQNSRNSFGK